MAIDDPMKNIKKRQAAYRSVFTGAESDKVLLDLARFCRAVETSFDDNPYRMAFQEGRREVFLRIMTYIDYDLRDVSKLINKEQGELYDD